jgi:hypothetical protein
MIIITVSFITLFVNCSIDQVIIPSRINEFVHLLSFCLTNSELHHEDGRVHVKMHGFLTSAIVEVSGQLHARGISPPVPIG